MCYYQNLDINLQSHAFHLIQSLSHYLHFHFLMLPQGIIFFITKTILVLTFYICQDLFNVNGYWIPSISILSFVISSEKVASTNLKLNTNLNFILFLIQNSCFALSRSSFLVAFSLILRDFVQPPSLGLTDLLHFPVELKCFHTN